MAVRSSIRDVPVQVPSSDRGGCKLKIDGFSDHRQPLLLKLAMRSRRGTKSAFWGVVTRLTTSTFAENRGKRPNRMRLPTQRRSHKNGHHRERDRKRAVAGEIEARDQQRHRVRDDVKTLDLSSNLPDGTTDRRKSPATINTRGRGPEDCDFYRSKQTSVITVA